MAKFKVGDLVQTQTGAVGEIESVYETIIYRIKGHGEWGEGAIVGLVPPFKPGDRVRFEHPGTSSDIGLVTEVHVEADAIRIFWLRDRDEMLHELSYISEYLTKE